MKAAQIIEQFRSLTLTEKEKFFAAVAQDTTLPKAVRVCADEAREEIANALFSDVSDQRAFQALG